MVRRFVVFVGLLASVLRAAPGTGADGTLDPGFGTGGTVLSTLGFTSCGGQGVVQQPDGKLVVGGFVGDPFLGNYPAVGLGFVVARYNTNGTSDPTFGVGGRVFTSGDGETTVKDLVLQPDGMLIAVGYRTSPPAPVQIRLVRYDSSGGIDMTYGTAGKVTATFSGGSVPGSALMQPDGKLLVVGTVPNSAGATYQGALARYNADGSPDMSFGTAGQAVIDFPGIGEEFQAVVLESDGRFYATGQAADQSVPSPDYERDFLVAHFNADGSVDTGYGTDGYVITEFDVEDNYAEFALSAVQQPDGKLVAAGFSGYHGAVARYNADGSLDATFGDGGKVAVSDTSAYQLLLQPDGKLVMVGHVGNSDGLVLSVTRLHPDGSVDASFAPCALVHTDLGAVSAFSWDALLQPDGKIVVTGWTQSLTGPTGALVLARYGSASTPTCQAATAGRSALLIRDQAGYSTDRLKWLWKGSPTTGADFGDPTTLTGYTMCVIDQTGGVPTFRRGWPTAPTGWSATPRGYTGRFGPETDLPFDRIGLVATPSGGGKIKVSATGRYLKPDLPLMTPVTVRLERQDGGHCWEATFSTPNESTASMFKARSD
jgi:uncharacterized delta-60 repeat protein